MPTKRNTCEPELARRLELERALRLLRAGKDPVQVIEALSKRLTNKLLHEPTRLLDQAVVQGNPLMTSAGEQ
jgi:glutamyl-tRNA reductase